jgi:cytochrome c oxidase subunit 4
MSGGARDTRDDSGRDGAQAAGAASADEGASSRALLFNLLALLALAGLSLALRFAHLGNLGMPVAMGIAVAKAVLVGLVFMELAFEKASIRFAFAAGLIMIAVLLSLMIADVMTRAVPPLQDPPGTQPRDFG